MGTIKLLAVPIRRIVRFPLFQLAFVVAVILFLQAGGSNLFGLRNAIARERGIAAYRAWVPLERIRPVSIPQEKWERHLLGSLITNRRTHH